MSAENLKRYDKPQKKNAYLQRCMLTRNGMDFPSAMNQITRNVAKAATGLALCAATGRYDANVISRAEVQAGVYGGCYDLDANRTASQIVQDFTGVSDPFAMPGLTEEQIAEHVGTEMVKIRNKTGKEKEKLCLTSDSRERVLRHLNEWISTSPELHTPFRLPGYGPLTLVKAMHLLDHVLATMYDMRYVREKNAKKKGQARIHRYSLVETTDFAVLLPGQPRSRDLPNIPPWAQAPIEDLAERDILQAADGIVQIAPRYAKRQAENFARNKLPGILPEDVEPPEKRRRVD